MTVEVIGSEGCRCLGDALRDLYAKELLRGHFVLLEATTVSNVNLIPILEEHKYVIVFNISSYCLTNHFLILDESSLLTKG